MHWYQKALTWVIVIAVGTIGSKFYKVWITPDRASPKEIVQKYQQAWDAAMNEVGATPPPSAKAVIEAAPLGHQALLRKKLSEIDEKYQPKYNAKLEEFSTELTRAFETEWMKAHQEFDDTPTPATFAAARVHHTVLEDKPEIKKKLDQTDDKLTKKLPRVRLALDSFSGYCVFRSREFRKNLEKKNNSLVLHLVDDGADYKKRIKTLESGDTPLAVFTIDALINNSALCKTAPASIVLLLDETQGADAIVSYREAFPNLEAMNRPDLKIVGVADSPSDTLARVVRTKLNLNKVPDGCFVAVDSQDDVLKQFRDASPTDPKVFVLWEPYLSQLLKESPQAHRLVDSSRFSGYIVDVLVVQKKYLKENREEVQAIVEAYLETLPTQRTTRNMIKMVLEDSKRLSEKAKGKGIPVPPLTEEEAEKVVQGIWWKTARENYAHFDLVPGVPIGVSESLDSMIKNISAVLLQTKALAKTMAPDQFVEKEISAALHKKDFMPRDRSWVRTAGDIWLKLRPVNEPELEPIGFGRGKAEIREEDEPALRKLAELVKGQPTYCLEIQGHHAKEGEADERLALMRAEAVLRWLKEQGGIPAQRMRAVVLDPVDSRGTESAPERIVTVEIFQTAQ